MADTGAPDLVVADGGYGSDLERLVASTAALVTALEGLSDAQVRETTVLPGWTRGHVLTHLARNADGMLNLVTWARTGEPRPMYASRESREADIAVGAARSAAVLVADVRDTAARLQQGLLSLREQDRVGRAVVLGVVTPGSRSTPADTLPFHRRTEVEVHRADLGLGYTPADWPADFAARLAAARADARAGATGLVGITTLASDEGEVWRLATSGGGSGVELAGPVAWLAAWLMGRQVPPGVLRTSDGSPVPASPAL